MKLVEKKLSDVGVIVGRFQVPSLHAAHVKLVQFVLERHKKVILFLGVSPTRVTRNNPLDFESRKQMLEKMFPKLIILPIEDAREDVHWSIALDKMISSVIGVSSTVTLYGGRDSFIAHYKGIFETQELQQDGHMSGGEIRDSISKEVMNTDCFRAGVIWAAHNQFPKVYPTVDVAILNEEKTQVLLGRKPGVKQFQFVGGFADPRSKSYEDDARREVSEETGLEVSDPEYVGSFYIDDWRYHGGVDSIKTLFFTATCVFGKAVANDDIAEVKWFKLRGFDYDNVADNHKQLMLALINKLRKK